MNVFDYVDYYKDYTFSERKFNEVDNIVFSLLSYVDFYGIVKESKEKITIKDAYDKFIKKYVPRKNEFIAIKNGVKLFEKIKDTNRYKDIKMMNYTYVGTDVAQFSAITFCINDNLFYVAFEGTDSLVSGWKEDCKMAYHFPVEAQVLAKKYLDKNFLLKNCSLIVGGHSKGGNLALVSSMFCNYFVKRKIIKIYSNDGQGLRKAQIESKFYEKIQDRFIHIIPNYSIVGLLLRHRNNYIVVKSSKMGILSHDLATWQVSYDHLEKSKLSRSSKVFEDGFQKWLDKYDDEKRKIFVKEFFKLMENNDIKDLVEINIKKDLILNIVKQSKELNPIVKEMTFDLFKVIGKTNFDYPLF